MRDRHLSLARRVQRAERIACPPRVVAYVYWDRGDFVELWGPPGCSKYVDAEKIGKPVVEYPDAPPPPDPAHGPR